jgi:uncharacterized protein (DUF2235 family)
MKNIVICCDGTENQISEHISNLLKLYPLHAPAMRKTPKTEPWRPHAAATAPGGGEDRNGSR